MNALLASLPDGATALPPADRVPHVLIKCGGSVFDITSAPHDVQALAMLVVEKQIAVMQFLNAIHLKWPHLDAAARQLITACGTG